MYVWSLVKPGFNAWRVASKSQKETGAIFSAMEEFTFDKSTELVAEAIPGTLIQLTAIVRTGMGATSTTAYFSFFFCIFTSSFTSALLSWDWDSSKVQRRFVPW